MAKEIWLACFGGFSYFTLELIYNGNSHWISFVFGSICFEIAGKIRLLNFNILIKCLLSGIFITAFEFFMGVIFNLMLNWNIWNYSMFFLNISGQICLYFSLIWIILSFPAIKLHQALSQAINPTQECKKHSSKLKALSYKIKQAQ